MRRLGLIGLWGATLVSAAGCGGELMTWRKQPPAPSLAGKVVITVADRRAGSQGGDDPSLVGSEHGALFIPHALRLSGPTEAADRIRTLVAEAALTAGVGVAPPGDGSGTARLAVEIHNMWCDGISLAYTKARLIASAIVTGPEGAVRANMPLQVEGAGAHCSDAYETMLNNAYSSASAQMSDPHLKAALTGGN
ncbi:MAG TPA: hypothetical protein VN947_14390 [Polyangia bacterium]|nr:hypothetical protein [Polyangia bacterium]